MRLKPAEVEKIKSSIGMLDAQAKIYLYGSRVDDALKGGDIDLLVFSTQLSFMDKLKIKADLHYKLGEQKIDLLVAEDATKPFVQLALESAILL
jgi:predicted nucleotidyltransferase